MEPKALPPAKINPTKLLRGTSSLSTTIKKISVKSFGGSEDVISSDSVVIKKQVIQVKDLIKTSTLLKQQEENTKRKETEQKRFSEKEKRLEKQEKPKGPNLKLPSLPKLGFLDRIKQFLFNLILGKITLALLPHIPKLTPIVSTIFTIQNNVIDWTGKILNGFITFVDKGYEAYDKSRNFLKSIGGENFTQAFDGFIGTIDKVIEASIIAAIAFSELRDGGGLGEEKIGKKGKPKVTTSGGRPVRRSRVTSGKGGKLKLPKGVKSGGGLLGLMFLIPDLIDSGMLMSQGRGKDGLRTLLNAVAGTVAGLGAYSATIAGATGLGITGVGLPAAIALAAAGFGASSLAGTVAFNLSDAALRKMGLVDKDPKTNKPYQYAGGGSVTRSGKLQTGPTRAIKKTPVRQVTPTPSQLQPGSDVGGEDKITKVFPKVEDSGKGVVNPLGYIEDVYKTTSKISYFGPLFGLVVKRLAGDKIDTVDYKNVGLSLNAWMNNTFSGEVLRTGGAFAGGGEVNAQMFMRGEDLSNVIAKSVEESVSSKLDKVIDDLERQLMLKPSGMEKEIKEGVTTPGGEMTPGSVPGGQLTVNQLVGLAKGAGFSENEAVIMAAIALAESGGGSSKLNNNPNTGDLSYGLWQINMIGNLGPERKRLFGISSNEQLFDPVTNAKAAYVIKQRQGFSAWSVYKSGTYKGFLSRAQAAKGSPSLATSPISMMGGVGYDGYITGDPSHPNYRADHGGGNYHDHLSFKDRATAEKAYKFFLSKGFKVAEFKGYNRVGRHSPGSLHYSGLAFDIPGHQVPVGQETQMSKRVRTALSEFKGISKFAKGGKVHGFTRAILGERGPEFVIDADSTAALEQNIPGFLNALNRADYKGALSVLRNYASYESGAGTQVIISEKMIPILFPMIAQTQTTASIMSSGDYSGGSHYMDYSYKQG